MAVFRPVALITGASTGIGAELARLFAADGHELVLVARSEQALAPIAATLGGKGATVHTVAIDLSRLDAPARLGHELAARGLEPRFVVNNAGFGLVGRAAHLDRAEQLAMIDLNVRALTDLSLRWLDPLRRHKGGLLNVASVAAFMPGPNMAVYYATKAFVLSFTEALHHELQGSGVRVTALCPGPVRTGFQARAGITSTRLPGILFVDPAAVARAGYDGLMAGRRVVVPGFVNRVITLLPRLLPRSVMLRAADTRQRFRSSKPGWPRP